MGRNTSTMMNEQDIIRFYKEQLKKFYRLQSKNIHVTEFGVKITPNLFEATQRRLAELQAGIKIGVFTYSPIARNGVANGS